MMGEPDTGTPPPEEGSPTVTDKPKKKLSANLKKKRRWKPRKKKPMQKTKPDPKTLEEMLPEVVPSTIISDDVPKARVKLKTDYWPRVPVENGDRLLAGSIVELPMEEAKTVVGRGAGELQF